MTVTWTDRIVVSAKQRLKRPLRRLARRAGYEIIERSRDEFAVLIRLLKSSGIATVVDVGANQGQYAEHLRAGGFTGRIVSFEPGARAFAKLAAAAAHDDDWDVWQLAVGDVSGQLELNVSANSVSSSLLPVGRAHLAAERKSATVARESVEVVRLDDACQDLSGPLMIKIDTQGYELPVLKGSEGLLDRTSILQVELSLIELYEGQASYLSVLGHLESRGLSPWSILPGFSDRWTGRLLQVDVVAVRNP